MTLQAVKSTDRIQAVVCREFGPVSDLTVERMICPEPKADELRIRTEAAGVNYPDALFCQGTYQIRPALPFVPGGELVGVVSAVGSDVSPSLVGTRVLGACMLGAFAEEVVVAAQDCVPLPTGIDSLVAASMPESFSTALYGLRERGRIATGEWILVLGAGSGVGLAAVQLARALGAHVIAGASSAEKRDTALRAGATATIDTLGPDLKGAVREVRPKGVDVVFDPVGGDLAESALRSLGWNGRYVVIGFAAGRIPSLPLNHVLLRNRSVVGAELGSWTRRDRRRSSDLLNELLAMMEQGRLAPPAPTVYRLADAGQALDDLVNRRIVGRVVVVP